MLVILILAPLAAATAAAISSGNRLRIAFLIMAALFHLGLVISFWKATPGAGLQGFL